VKLLSDRRGAAYVEFLLAFIPFFIFALGMVQMALMYACDLVVQHSASRAVRAAAVVLDDDPNAYDGQERMSVDTDRPASTEGSLGELSRIFGGSGMSSSTNATGGARMAAIRTAASAPLLAISPSLDQMIPDESVRNAIGDPESRASSALVYNDAAMAVSFPARPGASEYVRSFGDSDQVTARVTYLFHCAVPLVNRLMCESYPTLRLGPSAAIAEEIVRDLGAGRITFDEATERLRRVEQARARSARDQEAIAELGGAGTEELLHFTGGARYRVMRGEATMPIQRAHYRYPGE
jgi:hypothetical protein